MAKSKFTTEQLEAIARIQEHDGISRKSAVRKFRKQLKAEAEANRKATAKAPKQPQAKVSKPTTEAGKARSSGVQDFILAGRPTKDQFIAVYGSKGPAMTWSQRAALGVDAVHFQKALASGKCVAPAPKLKAMAATAHLKAPRVKKADVVKESDLASVQG